MGRGGVLGAVAVVVALMVPDEAPAFQVLGQVGPSASCSQDQAYTQRTQVSGPSYSPTVDSVITSFRSQAPAAGPRNLQLVVLHRDADYGEPFFHMTPVQKDVVRTLPVANQVATFTGLRIPIGANEQLGLYIPPSGGGCSFSTGDAADVLGFSQPDGDPPLGATAEFSGGAFGSRLNVEAIVEPDCDHDGFGDETQDSDRPAPLACAIDAIAPDTDITEHPRSRSFRRRARFEFTATDARAVAGFQCSLDGGEFTTCTSPYVMKVRRGRHVFEVRASDTAGNIDATAASDRWRVKRKKR